MVLKGVEVVGILWEQDPKIEKGFCVSNAFWIILSWSYCVSLYKVIEYSKLKDFILLEFM